MSKNLSGVWAQSPEASKARITSVGKRNLNLLVLFMLFLSLFILS
jgi:hypothetical protein